MERIDELLDWGEDHGLDLSLGNEYDWIPRIPFLVFEHPAGLRPLAWNVLTGEWRDVPVVWFDIEIGGELDGFAGSCAMVELAADVPPLHVSHRGLFDRVESWVPVEEIQTEWDQFNEHFRIRCEQPRFANDLLDARMLKWLFAENERLDPIGFDVAGGWAMACMPLLPPYKAGAVIDLAIDFAAHIPKVVYDLYTR